MFGGAWGPPCPCPSLGAIAACQVGFFSECKCMGIVKNKKLVGSWRLHSPYQNNSQFSQLGSWSLHTLFITIINIPVSSARGGPSHHNRTIPSSASWPLDGRRGAYVGNHIFFWSRIQGNRPAKWVLVYRISKGEWWAAPWARRETGAAVPVSTPGRLGIGVE